MAIGISIGGRFLTLYPDTKVDMSDDNDMYTGGDPLVIRKPRSMPFRVPTQDNVHILGYSHRPESALSFPYYNDVHIYVGDGLQLGAVLYTGTIHVKRSDDQDTEMFFTAAIPELSSKTFGDYDWGGFDLTAEDIDGARAHANATAATPLDFDHAFFPVYNPGWEAFSRETVDGDPPPPLSTLQLLRQWQNFWAVSQQTFLADSFIGGYPPGLRWIMSPFLRIDFIIQKIGEKLEYQIQNLIQTTDEMRLLYLYNNSDHSQELPDNLDYSVYLSYLECLPGDTSMTEFLKIIAKRFCAGIFVDDIRKQIWLMPYREVLSLPHEFDWTDKLVSRPLVSPETQIGRFYFGENADALTKSNVIRSLTNYIATFGEPTEYLDIEEPTADGFYYMVSQDKYVIRVGGSLLTEFQYFAPIETSNKKSESIKLEGAPLYQYTIAPMISHIGHETYLKTGDKYKSVRMMLYRGLKTIGESLWPYASNNAYDPDTSSEAYDYSLINNGDKGCYEVWFKEWVYLLENMRLVKMSFRLTIDDLTKLKPWSKIRVGSSMYLIKSRKTSYDATSMSDVECEMIRCN